MSYGIMSQTEVSGLADPSLAGVFAAVVGPWGAKFIAIGLIISLLGVLLSWVLLSTEILRVPATEGIMPRSIGKLNEHGTPTVALWASEHLRPGRLGAHLLLGEHLRGPDLPGRRRHPDSVPVGCAVPAQDRLEGRTHHTGQVAHVRASHRRAGRDLRDLAVVRRTGLHTPSAAVYLVLIPLFIKARREAGDTTLFKPFEWVVLGVLALMTAVFIVQVATGTSGF